MDLSRRRVVHECARIVLVRDYGGNAHQRLQHERGREVLQRDGLPGTAPKQVAHEGAQRALAVVAGRGVEPRALVPADAGADDRSDNLPQQPYDALVVGQLAHPGHDVPVGAVVVVVDDGVLRVVHEVHAHLAGEHEIRVETEEHLVPVVVHAIVHGDKVTVVTTLDVRAHGTENRNRLVDAANRNRAVVAADEPRQTVLGDVVGALVVAGRLVDADVEVAVVARILPEDAHRVMQLAHNQRNLVRVQVLAQAQAGVSHLLVGIGLLLRRAHWRVRVAGTQVVRLDGVVGRLQKLPLDLFGSGAYVHVDARQILLCDRSNQLVLGHVLTCGNERAIIITDGRGRPGSCAGIGAVFFFAHIYTSLIR